MRYPLVSLLMLLATISAPCQLEPQRQPDAARSLSTIFRTPAAADSECPVGLFAERRSETRMLSTGDSHRKGPGQGLHLTFSHRDQPQIESVEITVYGVTSKLRVLPAGMASSGEVSKTFQLQRVKGSEGLQHASIWMQSVGSLTRVELTSIAYADGTTWNESKSSRCQVIPSALMLISSK